MKSLPRSEERYYQSRIVDLARDVAVARERGRRDHAVNLLIASLVVATDRSEFIPRLVRGVIEALRGVRAVVADEFGEVEAAIGISALLPRRPWPETVRVGTTADLDVPFLGGAGAYIAASLGPHGYLYVDGIQEVDGLSVSARVIADTATLVAAAIAARTELANLAFTDLLTKIPNRLGFERAFRAAIERAAPFGLVYIDLDGFKKINDTQGHEAGDRHLQKTARALRSLVQVAGRLGGDEFVGLVDLGTDVCAVSNGLHKAGISCSVGVGWYPNDGGDVESLLRVADHAMFNEKRRRKAERA